MDPVQRPRLSRRDLLTASLAATVTAGGTSLGDQSRPTPATAEAVATPKAVATPATGAMPETANPEAIFAELERFVAARMAELKVPGIALGVIAGDRQYTATAGVTNLDHPLPVATDTLFQIGSTTKTYTGTALMRLVEQGTLDLEAPVRTYLPDFRVADLAVANTVRVRHLVTHTGGWYDNLLGTAAAETGDGDDALARFITNMAGLQQVAPLGEYFSYSNAGMSLAGRVIEVVTGQSYEAAIAELVLQPLGLERASFFAEAIMTEGFAVGHALPPGDPHGEPVVLEPWALPRSANPAGGLIASLDDELRYARFHLGDGSVNGTPVLSTENLRRMQTPLGPGGSTPLLVVDRFGVNWELWSRSGERIVSHPGGTNGQQSGFTLVPDRGFAITVLTNATAGATLWTEATDWALERFLGLSQPTVTRVAIDQTRLAEYAGEYVVPDGSETVRVEPAGDDLHLAWLAAGQTVAESQLRFVSEHLATVTALGLTAFTDFVRDDTGQVAWLRFVGRLIPRAA